MALALPVGGAVGVAAWRGESVEAALVSAEAEASGVRVAEALASGEVVEREEVETEGLEVPLALGALEPVVMEVAVLE